MSARFSGIFLSLAIFASFGPSPCAATLQFQAISTLDSWPAICAPGILHYQMTAFGAVVSKDESDNGRSWFLEGKGGRCVFLGIGGGSSCTASFVVGATDIGQCQADFEHRCVEDVKWGASAKSFTFQGESALDSYPCYEEMC
jgi:hypothetical protein